MGMGWRWCRDLPLRSAPYPVSAPGEYLTNSRAELPAEGLVHTTSTHHSCEGLHKDQIRTTHTQRDLVLKEKKNNNNNLPKSLNAIQKNPELFQRVTVCRSEYPNSTHLSEQ